MKLPGIIKIVLILVVIALNSTASFAQIESDSAMLSKVRQKVTMQNSNVFVGEIISDDGREILLLTEAQGKIYLPKADIKSIEDFGEKDELIKGSTRTSGPFSTRYYFTNNAFPAKKGESYTMVHIYGPEVHYAVSDNLTVGVMTTWIASPIGLSLKYSIKTSDEKLNLSLNTIMASGGYFAAQTFVLGGLHWGTLTYGVPGRNTSFNAGFLYIPELNLYAPAVGFGAIAPLGRRASFFFDSMAFLSGLNSSSIAGPMLTAFTMPGLRVQASDNFAFQFALAGIWNSELLQVLPVPIPIPVGALLFNF